MKKIIMLAMTFVMVSAVASLTGCSGVDDVNVAQTVNDVIDAGNDALSDDPDIATKRALYSTMKEIIQEQIMTTEVTFPVLADISMTETSEEGVYYVEGYFKAETATGGEMKHEYTCNVYSAEEDGEEIVHMENFIIDGDSGSLY